MIGRGTHIITSALSGSGDARAVLDLASRLDLMAKQTTDEQTAADLHMAASIIYLNIIVLGGVNNDVFDLQSGTEEWAKRAFLCEYLGQQTNNSRQSDVEAACKRLGWEKSFNENGNARYEYAEGKFIAESTLIRPLAESCDKCQNIIRKKGVRSLK